MKFLASVSLVAFVILSDGISQAAPMAYEFTGVIDTVDDLSGVLNGSVLPKVKFSGRFNFDSLADDLDVSLNRGEYRGPPFSLVLNVGSYSGSSSAGNGTILVGNDLFGSDTLTIDAGSFPIGGDLTVSSIGGTLIDTTASAFTSDSLPVQSFPLSAFQTRSLFLKGDSTLGLGSFTLVGTFTSFIVVPEPGVLSLMLFGILGVLGRRRAPT